MTAVFDGCQIVRSESDLILLEHLVEGLSYFANQVT